MASTRTELAQLAGRVAAVEATNRIGDTKNQPETLVAIADRIVGILESRDASTVAIAVASFASTLIEAAERGLSNDDHRQTPAIPEADSTELHHVRQMTLMSMLILG